MWIKSLFNSNPRHSAGMNNVVLPDHQIGEVYYITGRRNDDEDNFFGSKKFGSGHNLFLRLFPKLCVCLRCRIYTSRIACHRRETLLTVPLSGSSRSRLLNMGESNPARACFLFGNFVEYTLDQLYSNIRFY